MILSFFQKFEFLGSYKVRHEFDLPRVVCEYEDVFPNELLGLPFAQGCGIYH